MRTFSCSFSVYTLVLSPQKQHLCKGVECSQRSTSGIFKLSANGSEMALLRIYSNDMGPILADGCQHCLGCTIPRRTGYDRCTLSLFGGRTWVCGSSTWWHWSFPLYNIIGPFYNVRCANGIGYRLCDIVPYIPGYYSDSFWCGIICL